MSNLRAMVFALLAIVTLASCANSNRPVETRTESGRIIAPSYKGRTIVFDEAVDPPLLMIDGKPIKVRRYDYSGGKTGSVPEIKYGASFNIYADYDSLWQLARAMIDNGAADRYAPVPASATGGIGPQRKSGSGEQR